MKHVVEGLELGRSASFIEKKKGIWCGLEGNGWTRRGGRRRRHSTAARTGYSGML